MAKREHSRQIKVRFVKAVETVAKDQYPKVKEVDIIKAIGLTPPNFYRMRDSATNHYPTLDNCFLLCSKYNISAGWLITGSGPMKNIDGKKVTGLDLIKEGIRMLEKK